jgi:MerR family transcriptional regulator, copper efflux regulator
MFTIGKLASQVGCSVDAVRYYEKEGLLRPARRTEAGYRLYDRNAGRRIQFIRHAHDCGFTLAEIRQLLDLEGRNGACCNDVRGIVITKKLQLEQKIKAMKRMSNALTELIRICDDDTKPVDECPILLALETTSSPRAARRKNGQD